MAAHSPVPPTCNHFGDVRYENDDASTWARPTGIDKGLKVKNSLTSHVSDGRMDAFVPGKGNRVLWYTCGPTVYDSCHMGHARAYLTFDILRRITEDYFKYDVLYHVNITDVDDKIIREARRNHLVAQFREATADKADVVAKVQAGIKLMGDALDAKEAKLNVPLPEDAVSRDKVQRADDIVALRLKRSQLEGAIYGVESAVKKDGTAELYKAGNTPLKEILDQELGHTVSDHGVFDAHARKYEKEYFEDMDVLGVKQPDVLTRVTEYVPQIVDFIKKIIDNKLAYASNGSVYLSIDDFKKAGHTYRKLVPGVETSEADMAEGEGALGGDQTEKRNKNDFALWKASKAGEPSWDSPWGQGRPGWHIECSVVASDVLGPVMDVHAGGQDLKFPHHDNELAQSEACFGHSQWVNYFYHAGHLDIEGLKMSKSLKNFITIRQALKETTPRVIRLLFLLQPWHKKMNYSDQAVAQATGKEKTFREFFHKVKSYARGDWADKVVGLASAGARDRKLLDLLFDTQEAVDVAFKNNFDTPAAFVAMEALVSAFNKYESEVEVVATHVVMKIGSWITSIFRVLGLVTGTDEIGFGAAEGGSKEETLRPVLDEFVKFRSGVRNTARAGGDDMKDGILGLTDAVRLSLPKLGIALEDVGGETRWKLDDPAVLVAEMEAKQAEQNKQKVTKLEGQLAKAQKDLAKAEKVQAVGDPATMFKTQEKYAGFTFDDAGIPTKNAAGEDVAKSALKSITKEKTAQEKDWQKAGGNPGAQVDALKKTVADKLNEIKALSQ